MAFARSKVERDELFTPEGRSMTPLPTIIFIAGFVAVAAVLIALRGTM